MALEQSIIGVHHLGVMTSDIKKSMLWYEENLNFLKVQRRVVPMNGRTEIGILKRGDFTLELIQPSGRLREELKERKGGCWDHYALDAPELEKLEKSALSKGMVLHTSTSYGIMEYPFLGEKGVRGVNFCGPGGEVVEFCHDNGKDYSGRTGLTGWAHLALKVRCLKRSEDFYGKLGFRTVGKGYVPISDRKIQIHFLENKGFVLEVIETPENMPKTAVGTIDHVALAVQNIKETMDLVRMERLPFINYVIQELPLLERGIRFFFISGPDGEKIEFVENN